MPRRRIHLATLAAIFAACGGSETEGPAPTPVTEVAPSPLTGAWTSESARPVEGEPGALGVDGDDHVVLVVGGAAHVQVGGALEPRPLYAGTDEPSTMGTPRVVRPRPGGGAWIGGSGGLFTLDRHFVARSPLSAQATDVLDVGEAASGPLSGVWVLDTSGLWHRDGQGLDRIALDLDAARWIAVDPNGAFVVVASARDLRLLTADGEQLLALDVDLDTGAVRGLAAAPGAVFVATENGLFSTDGDAWRRFGLQGAALTEVATDPATGAAWARADATLWHVEGDVVTRFAAGPGETGLAVDGLGDVFGVASGALFERGTGAADGTAVTFSDVQPWLATHCSQCHQNQTADFEVYEVFVERAEQALSRVRSGDMPRCNGSVRCDEAAQLSPTEYAVLEQWIRDGMPE